MEEEKYVTRKVVLSTLKVSTRTLYSIVKRGEIETIKIGDRHMYNLNKFLKDKGVEDARLTSEKPRLKFCYCRVSSEDQSADLEQQIEMMNQTYPKHRILSDIGSVLNLKRKNLIKILDLAIDGQIDEIVISYKDRLARFGFDLIDWIIQTYSKGRIIIINEDIEKTPVEEITEDLLSIMNVYVAKQNCLKKHKKGIKQELKEI